MGTRFHDEIGRDIALPWVQEWGSGELEPGSRYEFPWIGRVDNRAMATWLREAVRFATLFGLLLQAEGAPITVRDERPPIKVQSRAGTPQQKTDGWIARHVYLDQRPRARGQPASAAGLESPGAMPNDRALADVWVRGHLRRQRVGPQRRDIKWIYVESHESRRWVAPSPQRVVVGVRPDP